jgi:hypothetical protein
MIKRPRLIPLVVVMLFVAGLSITSCFLQSSFTSIQTPDTNAQFFNTNQQSDTEDGFDFVILNSTTHSESILVFLVVLFRGLSKFDSVKTRIALIRAPPKHS